MNNEPVAWIARGDNTSVFFDLDCALSIDDSPTPLYTHPTKTLDEHFEKGFKAGKEEGWKAHKFHHPAKTLTKAEIEVLWEKHCPFDLTSGIAFAKAILKKASEK